MASTQPPSASPSNINSPAPHPGNGPLLNSSIPDFNARSSPGPASNASVQGDGARSKRSKRDSRKKREATKGFDTDGPSAPQPKKRAAFPQNASVPSAELSILRPLLLAEPRQSDLLPPQPRQMNLVYRKSSEVLGKTWEFYEIVDKLTNKNGFRYSYAIADRAFPHIKYRQTDVPPYHARFSFEDSPAAIAFTRDGLAITTGEPWQSARANVCAREGSYYYEARVISGIVNASQETSTRNGAGSSPRGHIRLGFARREADLDVNVGVDCYGYGIRDVNGEVVNRMRCEYFFPKGESVCEGDVIGMLIKLPSLSLHRKVVEGAYDPALDDDGCEPGLQNSGRPWATNIVRDRIPFHYKNDFCWQQSNVFPTKQLRDYAFNLKETPTFGPPSPLNNDDASLRALPGSSITVYKNGVRMGTPFTQLLAFLPPASRLANGTNNLGIGERENADDGMIGYYPAVSCYGGGAVECRFEAPWWIGPPPTAENGEPIRAIGERFTEQIVEDVLADIVDEVEAMVLWGGLANDVVEAGMKMTTTIPVTVGESGCSAAASGISEGADPLNGVAGDASGCDSTAFAKNNSPAGHEEAGANNPAPGDANREDVMSVDAELSPTAEAKTELDTGGSAEADAWMAPVVGTTVLGSAADEDVEMA